MTLQKLTFFSQEQKVFVQSGACVTPGRVSLFHPSRADFFFFFYRQTTIQNLNLLMKAATKNGNPKGAWSWFQLEEATAATPEVSGLFQIKMSPWVTWVLLVKQSISLLRDHLCLEYFITLRPLQSCSCQLRRSTESILKPFLSIDHLHTKICENKSQGAKIRELSQRSSPFYVNYSLSLAETFGTHRSGRWFITGLLTSIHTHAHSQIWAT